MRPKVERWLGSLLLGQARVEADAVRVPMRMEVETSARAGDAPRPRRSRTKSRPSASFWESWDAFLVRQILCLAGNDLTRDEKDILLTTLLDTRYAFVEALQTPVNADDLVRRQFFGSLAAPCLPFLRKYLMKNPSPSLFNYLAFFTASDALAALDKLGPHPGGFP